MWTDLAVGHPGKHRGDDVGQLGLHPPVRPVTTQLVHPGGTHARRVFFRQAAGVTGGAGQFLEMHGRDAGVLGDRRAEVPTHPGRRVIGVGVAHVAALAGIGGDLFRVVRLQVGVRAVGVC